MDHTVLLVLLLAFCTTASALDSEGTNFVFAFVRNAAINITNQELSVSVLNQNAMDCKFTLTYRPDYHKSTPPQNMTITVLSMGVGQINDIPQWYGWNYAGANVQDDVYLTLMAYSTCPVTLIAHNVDLMTGQGDSYMVLPTFWGSKSFTFSLPPAVTSVDQQYEQIFVLPTTDGVTRVNVVEIGNAQSVYSFNVTYGNAPAVYIGARTPDKRPRTYHVTSDKDVLIVAGVTCAGADANTCDHVAYMPHPPPTSDCYPYDYYDDDHVSYLPTTSQFFADIPGTCLVGQNITSTLNDGLSKTITIKPQMESPLWTIQTTTAAQLGVAFHNGGSNIHVARYYDGTKFNSRGAFVATSPSLTQFHNSNAAFFTRNANDSCEIYCNVLACASLTIDGQKIVVSDTKVVQKVDGISYYIFVITIPNAGFHRFSSNQKGDYSFFVFGKNKQYSYGYEGGVNKPTFVLAPPTTPGPSTASVSTQSTLTPPTPNPVTTQTTQTTAAPPTTVTTASPPTSVTSKQTNTVPSQTSSIGPIITSTQASPHPTSVTQTSATNTPILNPSTSASIITTPTPQSTATTINPASSTATAPTKPVVTTNSVTPAPSTATTVVTVPVISTITTQAPPVTSTVVTNAPTSATVSTVPTSSPAIATTTTTNVPVITTVTTNVPVVTTVTTNVPVVTTATTNPPVVTTQTTQTTPPPQTSSPTLPTTTAPATVGSTVTTPSAAPPATTTVTAAPPVTTTTTVTPPPTTTTTVKTVPTTTATKPTVPVTTPTTPPPVTVPVTTSTTAAPPVTTTTAPKPPPTTTTTTTTTTTIAPTTTTQSSSIVSIVLPIILTVFISLF